MKYDKKIRRKYCHVKSIEDVETEMNTLKGKFDIFMYCANNSETFDMRMNALNACLELANEMSYLDFLNKKFLLKSIKKQGKKIFKDFIKTAIKEKRSV